MSKRRAALVTLAVVAFYVTATFAARRRGYSVGGDTPVRCASGHVYTTIWIPGASLKSIRLGWKRVQWCPVGGHWSVVSPVRDADLSDDERLSAERIHDLRIP